MKGNVGRYIFVSTVSVYRQDPKMVKNEDAPILDCTIEQRAEKKITGENYGAKKAECERILAANDWLDSIILRPAIVYGPHDYTQRLYYWMYRIKNLNQVIVPGKGEELMNMTYAEDIVTLMKKCLDIPVHRKIYNTTTHAPNSLLDKLKSMAKALGKSPDWLFVDPKQILDNKEVLGGKIPQVYTTSNQYRFDHSKMLEDFGEFLTPFDTSIAETIKWHDSNKLWEEGKAGPTIEQEAAFLKTLKI
ncbi:MAG: NAD-dependent epimerase/dehydratase family protein [Bacteroidota bacterium]